MINAYFRLIFVVLFISILMPFSAYSEESLCVKCHKEVTPRIVKDFLSGVMEQRGMDCSNCHGSGHMTAEDVTNVQLPTEKTCEKCHVIKVEQYLAGKHALVWVGRDEQGPGRDQG